MNKKGDELIDYFRSLSKEVNDKFNKIKTGTTHPSAKGEEGENILTEFLQNYLSNFYNIYTRRQIIDYKRTITSQFDIIIAHRNIELVGLLDSSSGYILVESVAGVFEVKSTLTTTNLKDTIDKMKVLDDLEQTAVHNDTIYSKKMGPTIYRCVFAYNTGVDLCKIYETVEESKDNNIDLIVINGQGLIRKNDKKLLEMKKEDKKINDVNSKYVLIHTKEDTLLQMLLFLHDTLDIASIRRIDTSKYFGFTKYNITYKQE